MIHPKKLLIITLSTIGFLSVTIAQTASSSADTVNIPGSEIAFTLVLLPADTFQMGAKTVYLDSFYIGTHEVTYDEFILFYQREYDTDASDHPDRNYSADAVSRPTPQYIDYTYGMGKKGFPAVSMTQQAALRYCQWLYEKTGEFYRLPTEAEWEFACRGGKNQPYPQAGTSADDLAWHYGNSFEKYHEVGQKRPNDIGLYDILGNVTEWTLDDFREDYLDILSGTPAINPWMVPEKRHSRTVKGGSYDSDAEDCHCAARFKSSPRWQARDPQIPKSRWWNPDAPFVGFRLVRPVKNLTREQVEAFFEQAIKD